MKLTYKVIEDNAGGLQLYVFSKGRAVYAHYGFETTPYQLILCLDELDKGITIKDIKNKWDGCEVGDLNKDYQKTTSNETGYSIVAENSGKGRELYIDQMGRSAEVAFRIYEFEAGSKASLFDAKPIYAYDSDSYIKTVLSTDNRYECYIETNNGDIVEVPYIDDTEQMMIWLEGPDLTLDEFLEKVQGLEIWD